MSNLCPESPGDCSQEGPDTWNGLTSYALQINCINDMLPMSTRLASTFIPMCNFPEAIAAGVSGSEGLTEATSKAGVCPASDPAANNMTAPSDGNQDLDKMIYLVM